MQQPRATSAAKRAQRTRVIAAAVAVASLSGAGAISLAAAPANQALPSLRTADIHLVTTDVPPPPAPGQPAPNPESPTTVTTAPASPAPGTPAPTTTPAPGAPADAGRVNNDQGGFSYVVPQGWTQSDARRLTYGSALLTNPAAPNGSILLGRLDLKLFAGAEPDNQKASRRLASDMGEFFMPYPGNRVNMEDQSFEVAGMPAASSYYEVKFDDAAKETGQIWAAAVGKGKDRWFVVWLGTSASPVDKGIAKALTGSIRPWTPPTPPTAPPADPNQPPPPPADPNQPPPPADPNQPPPPPAPAAPGAATPEPAPPGQPAPPAAPAPAPAPGVPV
ncbi:modD [Mycobacterium sp. CBMA271]|uniref:APA family fibronectin-binding glycoprotein n=1 Tax=unclassified Mycobacteroides TaxID=2618759 RepID=UPI0012DD08FD|nr:MULTISPECIES: APA family fibronectin-binding glycoprotein [unclassified Mycobacteroides]MUM17655.1 modD [Mycobacteroides sp. CBMA 326]MUM23070.1 modD [Mycobacteroides sp. CBMA 271]